MAEVKGKFITLACSILDTDKELKEKALWEVKKYTGLKYTELESEGWYDTKVFQAVFSVIEKKMDLALARATIKRIGLQVYPTIKNTVGLPEHLKKPLDYIKYEAEGFLDNHRGKDIQPRKILHAEDKNVVIIANSPGYSPVLIEGVFLGILTMCGVHGRVSMKTEGGDCIYYISWV
ncbi:MAG: hypothetical protein H7A25_13445 [Leptospiraceae bacterium]|nr:hypothetical protein [Leptospiraceae bacterium]